MDNIFLINSLTGKKELFTPVESGKVRMYACGITPQSSSHIGHSVSAIRFAMIRKYLEFQNLQVTFVENITDIDDKIILKSKELNKSVREIAEENCLEYRNLLIKLGVPKPTFNPKATEYVTKIIKYIQELIELNYAYVAENGDVYFDISKKHDYLKLSKRKLEDSVTGTRIKVKDNKRNNEDFGLWKITNDGENFDSPWGKGRPGWHIECSAMANDILGETIDIHCGGQDLLFPHHENEIAQSEAHSGHKYVNYWIHSGLLTINNVKMSKSLNNFVTLKEGIDIYGTELLLWAVLRQSYRSNIDLNEKLFADNLNIVLNFYNSFDEFDFIYNQKSESFEQLNQKIVNEFKLIMNDDFNSANAIIMFLNYLDKAKNLPKEEKDLKINILKTIYVLGKVIGIFSSTSSTEIKNQLLFFQSKRLNLTQTLTFDYIQDIIEKVKIHRENKDYTSADNIRESLARSGVHLKYEKEGTYSWNFIICPNYETSRFLF